MRTRKSNRLYTHNYGWKGLYFVTIKTHKEEMLFGQIKDKTIELSEFGKIAKEEWIKTEEIRSNVKLDEFIVMPNHIHGIIEITNEISQVEKFKDDNSRGVLQYAPTIIPNVCSVLTSTRSNSKFISPANSLGSIIRGYKGAVTKRINIIRNAKGFPVWQRNYHDRIIRDKEELFIKRNYIKFNPERWQE